MKKYNVRENFKDIFGVYLLESQSFEGDFDMPLIGDFSNIEQIDYLALYSDVKDYDKTKNTCICFYQYDHIFDGINGLYNSIIYKDHKKLNSYKERFKNAKFIIAPDYSLFGDFPNALQIFNVYKSRVCSAWLNCNTNASIIPNVRWSFPFTYNYCFDGIMKGSNIAIGILGQIKNLENKKMFLEGFKKAVDTIEPQKIIVYGFVTSSNFNELFGYAISHGVTIIVPHSKIDKYKNEDAIYGTRC